MILISTGLWDTCLDEPFCCNLALNVNWGLWRGFVCGGGRERILGAMRFVEQCSAK